MATETFHGGRQIGKSFALQGQQIIKAPRDAYLAARNKTHVSALKALCRSLDRKDLQVIDASVTDWNELLVGKRDVYVVLAMGVWFRADDIPMLESYKRLGVAVFMR